MDHLRLALFTPHLIICGVIGLLIISIFAILITYDVTKKALFKLHSSKNQRSPRAQHHISVDLIILIYLNISLIFIYTIILLFRVIFPFHNNCKLINAISIVLFQVTRTLMFIIFIRRLQVIFSDTLFNSHKKYTFMLYFATAIYFISYMFYSNWSYKLIGVKLIHSQQNPEFGCVITYNSEITVAITSVLDITITSSCLYLFVSPLYKLIAHQDDESIESQLLNIIIKISILYGTAIFSSVIFLILKLLFPFGFYYGIIDGLINGMILIFLHPIHNTFYKNICCALHKCCIICCTFNHIETNKQETPNDPTFNLARISVLPNIASSHVSRISGTLNSKQTPINILLKQCISNAYKNAAQSQPAFNSNLEYKPKSIDELLAHSIQNMKKGKTKSIESIKLDHIRGKEKLENKSKTEEDTDSIKPDPDVHTSDTFDIELFNSLQHTVGIRDILEENTNAVFDGRERNVSKTSNAKNASSDMQLKSIKSNTLQFINYESTHL